MRMPQLISEVVTPEMEQIRGMIIETVKRRESIKLEMEAWYDDNPRQHFPKMQELIVTDATLSKLDTYYKKLWDYHNIRQ